MERRKGCAAMRLLGVAAVVLALASPAFGRIKLVTLPVRERVEIQLDNANATLVEEERIVTLLRGRNQIDFSWSNTRIDKGTIQFRVVDMPLRDREEGDPASLVRPDGRVETIRVIHVAYPPGENALVWDVYTENPVAARIRISYLIANLDRSFSYRAVAEHDESTLTLRKFIRLDNFSGEEFGTSGIWAGFGNHFIREIGVNEARQMLLWRFTEVPIQKTYTFDWWDGPEVPDQPQQRYVEMRYVLTNDEDHNLGDFPLQFGKVRIFQKDGRGGEAFIGEDWGQFTPIDDTMKLYLGLARDVEVKRRITENERNVVRGNLYHRQITLEYTIRNFRSEATPLDIVEDINRLRNELCGRKDRLPEWEIVRRGTSLAEHQIERTDAKTVAFSVPLPAAPEGEGEVEPVVVTVRLLIRNEW